MTNAPYERSQGQAAALASLDPRGRLRLEQRPISAPLFGGYYTLPQVELKEAAFAPDSLRQAFDLQGELTLFGRWQAPPFTPHRRLVEGYIHHAPLPHPPGLALSPQGLIDAFNRGEILLDGPTLHIARSLSQGDIKTIEATSEALRLQPHPVAPRVDLLPLRTPTIPPATHTNTYILGEERLVVIDPASPYPKEQARLLDHLKSRGGRVEAIVLTHHHGDHVGGATALSQALGCPILAHPITKMLLKGRVEVDATLIEGDLLPLPGPQEFKAVFTPGHAQGHLCFFDAPSGILIAGDMVAGWGSIIVDYQEGDMGEYLHHLGRLEALSPRVVLPAHGPPSHRDAGLISQFIAHRLAREEQVLQALSPGPLAPKALVDAIYTGLPPFLRPAAESSLIAHLIKLEAEGRISPTSEGRFLRHL